MNTLVQFIMKMLGLGGAGTVEKLIKDVLFKGTSGSGAKNPLEDLMGQFKDKGLGNIFNSWVGTGKNESITPQEVAAGIGPQQMAALSEQAKIPQDVLAQKLAQYLPGLIDKMTPGGKIA